MPGGDVVAAVTATSSWSGRGEGAAATSWSSVGRRRGAGGRGEAWGWVSRQRCEEKKVFRGGGLMAWVECGMVKLVGQRTVSRRHQVDRSMPVRGLLYWRWEPSYQTRRELGAAVAAACSGSREVQA